MDGRSGLIRVWFYELVRLGNFQTEIVFGGNFIFQGMVHSGQVAAEAGCVRELSIANAANGVIILDVVTLDQKLLEVDDRQVAQKF
jgi:hypothetical protein